MIFKGSRFVCLHVSYKFPEDGAYKLPEDGAVSLVKFLF